MGEGGRNRPMKKMNQVDHTVLGTFCNVWSMYPKSIALGFNKIALQHSKTESHGFKRLTSSYIMLLFHWFSFCGDGGDILQIIPGAVRLVSYSDRPSFF